MNLLIKNGLIVTMDGERRVIKDGAILVRDGRIEEVGKTHKVSKFSAEEVIDARGKAVLPGLINSHTHTHETLLSGVSDCLELYSWSDTVLQPYLKSLRREDCYWVALQACAQMIGSGITCYNDMFGYNSPILDVIIKVIERCGIRGVIGRYIRDAEDPKYASMAISDTLAAIEQCRDKPRIEVRFCPFTVLKCSGETYGKTRELASKYDVGLHTHMAETRKEIQIMEKEKGKGTVEYLDSLDFFGPDVVAAHAIWLKDEEIKILSDKGVKIVHNPSSNMKLASGVIPLRKLIDRGVTVALGTDAAPFSDDWDMFIAMRLATYLQKVHNLDAAASTAEEALELATINGAKALMLEDEIGSLEVGKKADMILIDLKGVGLTPINDIAKKLVFCGTGCYVDASIIDGEIVMENRCLKTVDESELVEKSQTIAEDLIESSGIWKSLEAQGVKRWKVI
ncbi:MAG: amidohydrolase family protein [Nitrososphaeria archaeon]|nr:amidohydrolase family protein [Nitrososphaeria archaeon]NIN52569.1 amidohydrolase family protein [Nitrososphaeria archaeon]NIQ33076.1 amidohydrolase family protein [Nitrososphaeria archaeon]